MASGSHIHPSWDARMSNSRCWFESNLRSVLVRNMAKGDPLSQNEIDKILGEKTSESDDKQDLKVRHTGLDLYRLKPIYRPPLVTAVRLNLKLGSAGPGDWLLTDVASGKQKVMADVNFKTFYEKVSRDQHIRRS